MNTTPLGYDINAMGLVGIGGLLVKVFLSENTSDDGNKGPAAGSVWGYGVTAASVLTAMFVTFALVSRMSPITDKNTFSFILALLTHSIPSLLLLGVLAWLIAINAMYYKRINKGDVADEYYTYSGVSTFLVVVQAFLLFKYIVDELHVAATSNNSLKHTIETALASKMASVTYLLTLANLLLAGIMTIILEYFSTDG